VLNQPSERRETSLVTTKVGLLLLLLISSFFALYKSNGAFTSDEVWSVKAASLDYKSAMKVLKADVHPPLYYQFLYLWVRLFGTGERVVRMLSALFYILSVLAVYGIGRSLYGNKIAFLSATIYLSSPLAILSSQFARMYALLSLLSVLSTWLYLQFAIKPRDSRLSLFLYIFVNVLGTFTHIAFFFILFSQIAFHFLFFRRIGMKKFIIAMALSLLPYIVLWAPVLMGQVTVSSEGLAWVNKPGLSSFVELLLLYGGAIWLLTPALLYVWWRTGSESFHRFSRIDSKSLPLWLLGIAILTPLLISQVKPIFNSRLAIVGLHLFALTVGAIVGKRAKFLLPVGLMALTASGLFFLHPGSTPCDNRSVADYLNQTVIDGDVVIFTSLTRLPIDYYLQRADTNSKLFETSFPAEIDKHPGYEGRINDPARRAAIELEAEELVDRIGKMQSSNQNLRIFFFHGFRPQIDSILKQRIDKQFELLPGQGVQCDETSIYFKEVSVYR
jgi:hypothetical protein